MEAVLPSGLDQKDHPGAHRIVAPADPEVPVALDDIVRLVLPVRLLRVLVPGVECQDPGGNPAYIGKRLKVGPAAESRRARRRVICPPQGATTS